VAVELVRESAEIGAAETGSTGGPGDDGSARAGSAGSGPGRADPGSADPGSADPGRAESARGDSGDSQPGRGEPGGLESRRAVLWCDGRRRFDLSPGARIEVRRGELPVSLARVHGLAAGGEFTDRLVAKFGLPVEGWRGRTNQPRR
jgi:hypothetical protein